MVEERDINLIFDLIFEIPTGFFGAFVLFELLQRSLQKLLIGFIKGIPWNHVEIPGAITERIPEETPGRNIGGIPEEIPEKNFRRNQWQNYCWNHWRNAISLVEGITCGSFEGNPNSIHGGIVRSINFQFSGGTSGLVSGWVPSRISWIISWIILERISVKRNFWSIPGWTYL